MSHSSSSNVETALPLLAADSVLSTSLMMLLRTSSGF